MINLPGQREEHTNDMAKARIPMTAAHVRHYIDQLEAGNPNKNARVRMAKLAIKFGNVTEDGKDVWREYLGLMK